MSRLPPGSGRPCGRPTTLPCHSERPTTLPSHSGRPSTPRGRASDEAGVLSLEAVWVLPALALLVVGLFSAVGLVRDVLLLHEAARAGARVAATTTGTAPVRTAATEAAPELALQVTVQPVQRRDGDLARVEVRATRTIGPVQHALRARAVARVEPSVGGGGAPMLGPGAP